MFRSILGSSSFYQKPHQKQLLPKAAPKAAFTKSRAKSSFYQKPRQNARSPQATRIGMF